MKAITEMTPAEYQQFMEQRKKEKEAKKPKRVRPEQEAGKFFQRSYKALLKVKEENPIFFAAMSEDLNAVNMGEEPRHDRAKRYARFKERFSGEIRRSTLDTIRRKAEAAGMVLEGPEELEGFYNELKAEQA